MSFKCKVKGMIKFILNNIPARKFDVRVVSLAPNELLKGRVALITGGTRDRFPYGESVFTEWCGGRDNGS